MVAGEASAGGRGPATVAADVTMVSGESVLGVREVFVFGQLNRRLSMLDKKAPRAETLTVISAIARREQATGPSSSKDDAGVTAPRKPGNKRPEQRHAPRALEEPVYGSDSWRRMQRPGSLMPERPGSSKPKPKLGTMEADLFALGARKRMRETPLAPAAAAVSKPAAPQQDAVAAEQRLVMETAKRRKAEEECNPALIQAFERYAKEGEESRALALIANAVGLVRRPATPGALDPTARAAFASVALLARSWASLFQKKPFIELLLPLLKHGSTANAALLACDAFQNAFAAVREWPVDFVLAYLEDLMGERNWSESETCSTFTSNVLTAFAPPMAPTQHNAPLPSSAAPPLAAPEVVEEEEMMEAGGVIESGVAAPVASTPASTATPEEDLLLRTRYSDDKAREFIKTVVIQLVNSYLVGQGGGDVAASIKVLVLTVPCYKESRIIGSAHIEEWLNNTFQPSVPRFAKELLARLVQHTRTDGLEDLQAVENLLRVKVKPTMQQFYLDSFFQLLRNHALYPLHALRTFIVTDVLAKAPLQPPNLPPAHVKMLGSIVKCLTGLGTQAEIDLGLMLQELAQQDEYRSAHLRAVLRILSPRDLNVLGLCRGLMQEPRMPLSARLQADGKTREGWLLKVVELITSALLFSVPTDAPHSAALARQSREFKIQVGKVQKEAMAWCQQVAIRFMPPVPQLFVHLIKKLLFILPAQSYLPEGAADEDRQRVARWLCAEIPLFEDTLVRLLHMYSADLPITAADALEICEVCMRRAAAISVKLDGMLDVQSTAVLDLLLQLSVVRRVGAPKEAKAVCQASKLWQAVLLCVLAAPFNAASVGHYAWNSLPTVRAMMEMLVTRSWRFPAVRDANTEATQSKDAILAREESETLESDMMYFEPAGSARAPPPAVLRRLQQLDEEFGLGTRLCSSRSPDFLSMLLRRQLSAGRADDLMRWLAPLLHTQGDAYVTLLPVSPLCEILMHTTVQLGASHIPLLRDNQQRIAARLLAHIKEGDTKALTELFSFFLSRLAAPVQMLICVLPPVLGTRTAAKQCLTMLLCENAMEEDLTREHAWLAGLSQLCTQHAPLRATAVRYLLASLQRESAAVAFGAVLAFAAQHSPTPLDVAMSLGQLIAARGAFVAPLFEHLEFYTIASELLLNALRVLPEPRPALPFVQITSSFAVPQLVFNAAMEVLSADRSADATGTQLAELLFPPSAASGPMLLAPNNSAPPTPLRLSEPQASALLRSPHKRLAVTALSFLPDAALLRLLETTAFSLPQPVLDVVSARLTALPDTAWYTAAAQLADDAVPRILFAMHVRSLHPYGVAPPNSPLLSRLYKLHITTSSTPLPQVPPISAKTFFSSPPPLVLPPNPPVADAARVTDNALLACDASASLQLATTITSGSAADRKVVLERAMTSLRQMQSSNNEKSPHLARLLIIHLASKSEPTLPIHILGETNALLRLSSSAASVHFDNTLAKPTDAFFEEHFERFALRQGETALPALLSVLNSPAAPLALDWIEALTAGSLPAPLLECLFLLPATRVPVVALLQSLLLQRAPTRILHALCWRLLSGEFGARLVARNALQFLCAALQPEHRRREEEEQQQRRPLPTPALPATAPMVLADVLCDAAGESAILAPSHLSLLLALLRLQQERVMSLALHLSHRHPSPARQSLQAALYLTFPELAAPLSQPLVASAVVSAPSHLDGVLHRIIKELLGTEAAPAAYALARRLGSRHPQLLVRYLPILSMHVQSILKNCRTPAHVAAHSKFLLHLLGLLDVLRPHVFTSEELTPILDTLLQLQEFYLRAPDTMQKTMLPVVGKLIDFLCFFAVFHGDTALIRAHKVLLNDLSSNAELKKATVLLNVTEHRQPLELQNPAALIPPSDLAKLRSTLNPGSPPATVSSTLYDLEVASSRAPGILQLFSDQLLTLVSARHVDEETLTAAHRLLVRLVQSSPSEAERVVAASVKCLGDSSDTVRRAALKHVSEVFHYSREHSASFLIAIFQQGRPAAWELRQLLAVTTSLLK